MKAKLHVACSPLTNRIHCGTVTKDGRAFREGKQDITGPACGAVAEHVVHNGGPVVVTANGVPKWEIHVKDLSYVPPAVEPAVQE